MRVLGNLSTYQFSLSNRLNVARTTMELQRASQEVSTGKKWDVFAELGPRAASIIKLRNREAATQTFIDSNALLGNKLDAMLTSVDSVRSKVQAVLETSLVNATRPDNGAATLQLNARAALESIVATLNTSFNGEHLFSGLRSDQPPLLRWEETNAGTGLSPEDVLQAIVGAGPTDALDAAAISAEITAAFSSTSGTASYNFEATFYQGTPALDGGGQPSRQVSAWVNVGQEVVFGARANDSAFREAYKGLAMLASTDVSQLDPDAYVVWMDEVITSLSNAQNDLLNISARTGFNQQIVETTQTQLRDLSFVQQSQIGNFENVDPYEAVTRMQLLETQLEASYQVTGRLGSLSILPFLR